MQEELIETLATAARIACARIPGPRLADLQACLDRACAVPAEFGWERKAAAHAEFLNAMADAAADPRLAPVLSHGAGLAYELMLTASRAADGIVINSRKRMLAHLRAGDADTAAVEMETHLRTLHFMCRLATLPAKGAAGSTPRRRHRPQPESGKPAAGARSRAG